jgi:ABC-type multidrug transport system fused ATPase/permease subunit
MCHMTWSCAVQLIVIAILLIYLLGPSALAGFAVFILLSPFQGRIMRRFGGVRSGVAAVVDERVKLTQESLMGIKVIKFYGWEDSLAERIKNLRLRELSFVRTLMYARSFLMAFGFVTLSPSSLNLYLMFTIRSCLFSQ